MKSSFVVPVRPYFAPGSRSAPAAAPSPSRSEKFMLYFASTQTVINAAPAMSSTALMICT